jgi:YfiH family protein
MEPARTFGWLELAVGRDQALAWASDEVTMAFGLGPPLGGADINDRLVEVLRDPRLSIEALRRCRQVHGARILLTDPTGPPILEVGDGDGLATASPGVGLAIVTADCVPVLVAGGGAVAAIHAGWRGCATDVAGAAVETLETALGVTPSDLRIALGPAVCGGCYRVGPEVSAALRRWGVDEAGWRQDDRVDLRAFLRGRFAALGVPTNRIETVGGCTVESAGLASYRRDGANAGRQWSMVVLHI